MLKRYFIPLMVALALLAVGAYFIFGNRHTVVDVRTAVPVEKFTLSNGLEVVVMPNNRIPLVSHLLIVKAGGADDPQGKSGLAHYLEHLMFTGTKNFPEGTYDRSVARVGGQQNASTGSDYTMYYATVPKEHLAMVMTMEADRLMAMDITPEHAARELKVITEERNMRVDTNPASQWREQLDAMTFLNHPYHNPVIGWAEDMASFTAQDARTFFEKHYRADNMILVVAGDVSGRDVRRMAQRYYGALPAGGAPARAWAKEPPVRMARRGEMHDARVNEPRLMRQYVAPSVREGTSANATALSVFAHYLGGGNTSALYTALVREQNMATSVSVFYDPMTIGPALFRISATPAPGVTLVQLEAALDRELARVLASPLDVAAVARAKTLLRA
jgi:zinc protease